ncbi:MAG: DciA family protein [Hyalangium sp.]|uniref:DciA family protein n=1 Tax=Hyalangium sp. TaxID=2028555 RepID=UPI003899CF20
MARQEPKSLESLLPRILARIAEESGKGHSLAPVWAAAVGPQIARHTSPYTLQAGTLVVTVASAEWARTLSLEEASLCERLNARLGAGTVKALSFRLGG